LAASFRPLPLAAVPREDKLAREGKRPTQTLAVAEFQGVSRVTSNSPRWRECSSHSERRWLGDALRESGRWALTTRQRTSQSVTFRTLGRRALRCAAEATLGAKSKALAPTER